MKVAVISELYLGGVHGVARTLFRLLEHLREADHEIVFFAPKGGLEEYREVVFETYPGIPLPIYPELRAAIPRQDLKRKLQGFKPDVVHLVHPMWFAARGLQFANELGLPTVASFHSPVDVYAGYYWSTRFLKAQIWNYSKLVFNQADLVLCPTSTVRAELIRNGMQDVYVWGRGVDSVSFDPAKRDLLLREKLLGPDKRFLLLYVGRLAKEKNVQFLVHAAKYLSAARLIIVGDGPDRKRLESLFATTDTIFTGYLTGERLERMYASADVFVFPSVTETFGQVITEAMASGLPVVALESLASKELISNGKDGVLCSGANGFLESVRHLLNDLPRRTSLSGQARNVALGRTWEGVMEQLLDYYALAISKYRSPQCLPQLAVSPVASLKKNAPSNSSYVEVCGQYIHYRKSGNGPAMVLIHGALGSWEVWSKVIPILSARFSVYALDLIGSGQSSKPFWLGTIDDQVALIQGFISKLKLGPTILLDF